VSRDQSVRRSAQDDESVGVLRNHSKQVSAYGAGLALARQAVDANTGNIGALNRLLAEAQFALFPRAGSLNLTEIL
jgi:hypothetical protein